MDKRNALWLGFAGLATAALMTACGGPSVRVPVTRPAEIYLKEPRKVIVNDLRGDGGQAVAAALTNQIVRTGMFEVYDRARLEQKLRESNPSMQPTAMQAVTSAFLDQMFRSNKQSGLDRGVMEALLRQADPNLLGPDQKTIAAAMEKIVGGGYLLSGDVTTFSYTQKDTKGQPTKDSQGKMRVPHMKKGTASVAASVQITNLSSGTIVAMKNLSQSVERTTQADNAWPPNPDRNGMLGEAVNGAVTPFIRMIAPYTEYVTVSFAKNELKMPELDQGVNYAKTGLWPEAAEQFKTAASRNPSYQAAWFNLGIAYEYGYRFAEAEEAFKQAAKVGPCDKCGREIQNVRSLAEQRKRLAEQGVK